MAAESSSIETKLTVYVLLFSVLFGVIFSAIQIRLDYQTDAEKFNQNLDKLITHQSGQLVLSLQQYHSAAIQKIFESLMLEPAIVSLQIEDEVSGYRQNRGLSPEQLQGENRRQWLRKSTDLMGQSYIGAEESKIGTLTVWVDSRKAHEGFRQRAMVTALIEVVRAMALAMILVVVLKIRLARPLHNLTERLRVLEPGDTNAANLQSTARYRELDDLVEKINSLFASFDIEMQRRRQAEKRARYLNDKLEEKVRARTQELKDSNSQLQSSLDELQRTQQLLLQAQRMASLGHLAAGIAHEINNPVAVVYSNIATLSEYLTELIELADQFQSIETSIADLNIRQVLAGMRRAIDLDFVRSDAPELVLASQHSLERVRNIVAELKTFAIQEGQAKRSADLFDLMQQAVVELKLDHDERIRVDIQMAGIPRVDCIAGQVRLAFRHILDNARDAIIGDGRIEIAAAQVDDQVQVVVKDSGTGMDSEVLSCAINPFFTRKEVGKGTGLGLTVAFNVMVNHGGSLDIASQPGRGTTVTFTLPIAAAADHF